MIEKIIPDYYCNSIYDVPYNQLYEEGHRLILTDLDNTLISYKETKPNLELFSWLEMVNKIGYEVIIVSNSRKNRVENFASDLGIECVKFSTKPLKRGFKKAMKKTSRKYSKEEIL